MTSRSAAAIMLLAVAACGGGADSPVTFAERVNAICAQSNRKLDTVPRPTTAAETDRFLRLTAEATDDGVAKLRQVEPPAELRDELEEMIDASRDASASFKRAADAMRERNKPVVDREIARIERARARFGSVAEKLELDECIPDASATPSPSATP